MHSTHTLVAFAKFNPAPNTTFRVAFSTSVKEDTLVQPAAGGVPSADLFGGLEVDADDPQDNAKESSVGGKQPPELDNAEIIAAIYTVTQAKRRKAQAPQVERAQYTKEHYKKYCLVLVHKDANWKHGSGHPEVEDSIADDISIDRQEDRQEPADHRIHLRHQGGQQQHPSAAETTSTGDGKPPSGKQWSDVMTEERQVLAHLEPGTHEVGRQADARSLVRADMGLFLPLRTSAMCQEFSCILPRRAQDKREGANSRAGAMERDKAVRKREKRQAERNAEGEQKRPSRAMKENEDLGGVAVALSVHNDMWKIQIALKYGSAKA
eukprot:CAMPEP_0117697506 /NCGR_PEP_ID=MMETSP0804-20121206/29268_1 /TAXON_ID=1074897 /ORGANISM="Tetraselmis astigmatica, Strain CCMP880" /LENGTH=322 /DNA_ID=CAMNT_0005511767 /DNA_START=1204 /DNA_END=2173 /DNA_ORIENTATION=+